MTRTLPRIALSAVAIVALGACGSSAKTAQPPSNPAATSPAAATTAPATTTPAPAKLDSCALVTQAQADALIGAKLLAPLHVSTTEVDSCTYPGDPNGPTAQVEVYIGAGAKTYYDDDNNVLHHTFTDVPGVGDESHEEDYALFFRKGPTWVALTVTSLDDFSTFKPRLEALAKDLASRI
jgi:Protein of unknown function (DUF3558)